MRLGHRERGAEAGATATDDQYVAGRAFHEPLGQNDRNGKPGKR
jgi:hypothetical protein